MNKPHHNPIDFLYLVTTIWQGKWIIILITIVTGLVGIYYSKTKPNLYQVVTPIENGKPSEFISYLSVNSVLTDNDLYLGEESLENYLVTPTSVFEMFISEFNDYEEMISVLQKDDFVKNSIKNFSVEDKRKKLISYAKSFVIIKPTKMMVNGILTLKNGNLTFKWHNAADGSRLFNEAILLTLSNVKSNLVKNFNKLALSMEAIKINKLETISDKINAIEQTQDLRMTVRVKYLKEHADIARELGIEKNTLSGNALDKTKIQTLLLPPPNVELSMNKMNDFPYYLRGFIAIDKEISLIKNRTKNDQLLLADNFINLKSEYLEIKNDSSASKLRNFSKTLDYQKSRDWVQFDFALANIKSHKKSLLYIFLSVILGLMIGTIYVIFIKIIRNLETQKNN